MLHVVLAPRTRLDFGGTGRACLHPLLGDPCLLWVLRALPLEAPVRLLHGDPGLAEVLPLWKTSGLLKASVTCQGLEAETPEAMLRAAGAELSREEAFTLCFGDAPLLDSAIFAQACALQPLRWSDLAPRLEAGCRLIEAVSEDSPWRALWEAPRLQRREDLPYLHRLAQRRMAARWMARGVSLPDPDAVCIGPRVELAADVTLEPGVRLEGAVRIGPATRVAQGCVLQDTTLGANVEARPYCVATQAVVGDRVKLGPFAHLREGSVLESDVHVGNFVETKKTTLRQGAKANHLSYLGDAEVGAKTNIGAGCITCNYDGFHKHRTVIGQEVFVGSDCQLVAPVTLGDRCLIAAGTTVTRNVAEDALALARAPQVEKTGYAKKLRELKQSASS